MSASYKSSFYTLISLFFIWGFITCLNDILIPHLKETFSLSYLQANMVQYAFFGAYFIVSLIVFIISQVAGDPIARLGYQKSLVLGLVIAAVGCGLFLPACIYNRFEFFIGALFVLASGITIIQIAANPFVSVLGDESTASSRLNLAQAFNSFGYVIAPVVGALLIFGTSFASAKGADSVKIPYLGLSLAFLLLAVLFSVIKLPVVHKEVSTSADLSILSNKGFVFGMLAIFLYVGAEVSTGGLIVNYLGLPQIKGFSKDDATPFLSFYWGGAMIGRFMGAISLSDMKDETKKLILMAIAAIGSTVVIYFTAHKNWDKGVVLLTVDQLLPYAIMVTLSYIAFIFGKKNSGVMVGIFATIIILLVMVSLISGGDIAMWAILAIGLFNSVMWSNIFTLSIAGLGDKTPQGSALLIMMIVGGALVPLIQSTLADAMGLQASFVVQFVCYAYLAYFGFSRAKLAEKA